MIARSTIDVSSLRSEDLAETLQQVTLQASSLGDALARLQQGFDQAAESFARPTPPSPPGPGALDLALGLQSAARQIASSPDANDLQETLANALALMNELAANMAAQSDVREIANQIENLRAAVNTLSARSNLNRLQ